MFCSGHDQAPNQKHGIEDTPREQPRDASYIFGFWLKIWSFRYKAKYARLRTPRRPRTGLRESSSTGFLCCRRQRFRRPRNYNKTRTEVRPLFYIFCNSPPAGDERLFRARRRCQRTMREVYHLPPTPVKSGKGEVWVFGSLEVETRRDYPPDGSCPRIDTNFTNTNQSVLIREIRGQTPTFQTSKPPNQILL